MKRVEELLDEKKTTYLVSNMVVGPKRSHCPKFISSKSLLHKCHKQILVFPKASSRVNKS